MPSSNRRSRSQGAERNPIPDTNSSSARPPKWEKFAIFAAAVLALCPLAGPSLAIGILWTTRTFRNSIKPHSYYALILTCFILFLGCFVSAAVVYRIVIDDIKYFWNVTYVRFALVFQHTASVVVVWYLVFQAWYWQRRNEIRQQRSQPNPHEGSIPLRDFSTSGPETSDDAAHPAQRARSSSRRRSTPQVDHEEESEAAASGSEGDGGHAVIFGLSRRSTANPTAAGSRRGRSRSSSTYNLLDDAEAPGVLSRPQATHPRVRRYSSEAVDDAAMHPHSFV